MGNIFYEGLLVSKSDRENLLKQKGKIIWLTGLSGSGKSTIGKAVEKNLFDRGYLTYLVDGDNLRLGLNSDLGFSKKDREENLRRVKEVSKILLDLGIIVIATFISPYRKERESLKKEFKENFIEVFVDTEINLCEERDCKGLYKLAREGKIENFTGISEEYERPENPDLIIKGLNDLLDENIKLIIEEVLNEKL